MQTSVIDSLIDADSVVIGGGVMDAVTITDVDVVFNVMGSVMFLTIIGPMVQERVISRKYTDEMMHSNVTSSSVTSTVKSNDLTIVSPMVCVVHVYLLLYFVEEIINVTAELPVSDEHCICITVPLSTVMGPAGEHTGNDSLGK